jgi:hypothetical protein
MARRRHNRRNSLGSGMRITSSCTYKPSAMGFAPVYRGTKHDRTMTQRRAYNPKRKNIPREVGAPCDTYGG